MTELPDLILARDALRLGTDRELRRRVADRTMVKVATGVFLPAIEWNPMTADERYRTRVRAAALISSPSAQFSHESAAAMWNLPSIGPWPAAVHELTEQTSGGRSRVGIVRHGLGLDGSPMTIDGVTVTSLARTVVDVSCTTSFVRAVAMADAALHAPQRGVPARTSKLELQGLVETLVPYYGMGKATRVINFANGESGSAGESFARVQFHALGFPPPELQVDFFDELGFIGCVDFFWRELGLIGEFDGKSKYGARRLYQKDLTSEQIVLIEKDREDRLRRVAKDFVRLDWPKVNNRRMLASYLARHGLIEVRGR